MEAVYHLAVERNLVTFLKWVCVQLLFIDFNEIWLTDKGLIIWDHVE